MNKKHGLINEEELRALIDRLYLKDEKQKEFLKARWLNYVLWWDSRSRDARKKYHALRSAVVIAGALIPALVGLRELNVWGEQTWIFSVASILASLVVAICAGIESLFNYGEIWREKRAAAELMKGEGFRFFQLAGEYSKEGKSQAELYATFAAKGEDMIEREIRDYIVITGRSREENRPAASTTA